MSRRWIISTLVLWSLLASLPLGLQTDGPSATWLAERAEALESASPTTTTDRPPTAPHIRREQAALQKAHDYWHDSKPGMANPCQAMSEGVSFRIASVAFPQATIASMM
jgi:hypothetical protein